MRTTGSAVTRRPARPSTGRCFSPRRICGLIEGKAMTFLGQADLPGGRAVLAAAPREVEPAALVAYVAAYWDVVWLLDDKQRDLLVSLSPSAFDGDRATWGLCLAQAYALKGDVAKTRYHAAEARKAIEEQLQSAPEDAQRRVGLGLALAYMGDTAAGIREAQVGRPDAAHRQGRIHRALPATPARADLRPRGRAREGARSARASPEDPLHPLAGMVADRSELRTAPRESPIPEARRGCVSPTRWSS